MTTSNDCGPDTLTVHALIWLAVVSIMLTLSQLEIVFFFGKWFGLWSAMSWLISLTVIFTIFVQVSTGDEALEDGAVDDIP